MSHGMRINGERKDRMIAKIVGLMLANPDFLPEEKKARDRYFRNLEAQLQTTPTKYLSGVYSSLIVSAKKFKAENKGTLISSKDVSKVKKFFKKILGV